MNTLLAIIITTVRESIRKKQLYVLLIFGILVVILTSLANFFEMNEQTRFIKNISIFIIPIIGVIVATFSSARQLPNEIEDKSIHPLLVKPISRWEYIIGKYLGVLVITWFSMLIISLIFLCFIFLKNIPITATFFQCIILFLIQIAIYISIVLFFSTILSHGANIVLSLLLFVLLHSYGPKLNEIISGSTNILHRIFLKILFWIPPHFDYFNISSAVIYDYPEQSFIILIPFLIYAIIYIAIFLMFAGAIFSNKEL